MSDLSGCSRNGRRDGGWSRRRDARPSKRLRVRTAGRFSKHPLEVLSVGSVLGDRGGKGGTKGSLAGAGPLGVDLGAVEGRAASGDAAGGGWEAAGSGAADGRGDGGEDDGSGG